MAPLAEHEQPLACLLDCSVGDVDEARDLEEMCRLANSDAPFDRSSAFHLTASALVVEPMTKRVLLRWHSHHLRWMQVGGHGDAGEHDPFLIALREAEEETGLGDLVAFPDASAPRPIQVGIVDVGASATEPAHRHGDIRFVMATSSPDAIVAESEDAPLRWCTLVEADDLVVEENLKVLLARVAVLLNA